MIDWIAEAADALDRRLMVRLVKGAYWDSEIKRAQERGLADYPVFSRKAMTDLCYLDCVRKLLEARPRLYPQFATHNALTVASVIEDAGNAHDYEFQRLHGMGEALYHALLTDMPDLTCRVYAPVGGYADLLAYLVRRLLENGANSSFVSVAADPNVPIETVLRRPQSWIGGPDRARHPHIPLPRDLFAPERRNSMGIEFGDAAALEALRTEIRAAPSNVSAAPLVDGVALAGRARSVVSPIDGESIGTVKEGDEAIVAAAMSAAQAGFPAWSATPVDERAAILERAGDLIERNRGRLIALLQSEAGKTLDDCVSEVREAADYCRYYAARARDTLAPQVVAGPDRREQRITLPRPRRHRLHQPVEFPAGDFYRPGHGALAAGNSVVAKSAEQTPLIAYEAVQLLHQAGVPASALHLVPGDGKVGGLLTAHPAVAGVAFTGSTEVARIINRALAAKDGPIPALIAETGGINAMIVDATALPEQVTDDVIASAFRSAGQRCSALAAAMRAGRRGRARAGDGRRRRARIARSAIRAILATQVGPVIDAEARDKLERWIAGMHGALRFRWEGAVPARGTYVAPAIIELDRAEELKEEVFGPVLHVVRWRADEIDRLLDDLAGNGTALTLGIHSRIDLTVERIAARLANGNVYVNRNMIGAVVGASRSAAAVFPAPGRRPAGPTICAASRSNRW